MIPLAVIAKNEERAIGASLTSLLNDVEHAERQSGQKFDVIAILDDCSDGTEKAVRIHDRVRIVHSSGGIVEAQRMIARTAPFVIFADADILVEQGTILGLVQAMQADLSLQVAYPRKLPLPPRRRTWLARALYTYNRVNGFQTARRYFNGRLFAVRDWNMPTLDELSNRLSDLPRDNFYNFHAGMRVDDIYLSRDILARYGTQAIQEIDEGMLYFQPPETFSGMYRTYRRMRMEIERLNIIFPELNQVHRAYGVRRYDRVAIRQAPWRDLLDWYFFRIALGLCILRYRFERAYYRQLSKDHCPAWEPINESKCLPNDPQLHA